MQKTRIDTNYDFSLMLGSPESQVGGVKDTARGRKTRIDVAPRKLGKGGRDSKLGNLSSEPCG